MPGVFGNRQIVEKQQPACAGQQRFNVIAVFIFKSPAARHVDVASPSQRHAGLSTGQVVNHGAGKETDVRSYPGQHVKRRLVVGWVVGISVFAQIMQCWRNHFGRGIQKHNAARFKPGGVDRAEDQVPGVGRHRHSRQRLGHFGLVDAHRGEAPGPRHQVVIACIDIDQLAHDGRVQIGVVADLGFIKFLQQAAVDLRLGEHGPRHHDVVAGVSRHQFGLQRFVVFKRLEVDLDARLFFEIRHHVFGDVVRPVVNVQHLFFCAGWGSRCTGRPRCIRGFGRVFLTATYQRSRAQRETPQVLVHDALQILGNGKKSGSLGLQPA